MVYLFLFNHSGYRNLDLKLEEPLPFYDLIDIYDL